MGCQAKAARKKSLPALASLRFETSYEGLAAKIMRLGPYEAEAPTVTRLHALIGERGHISSARRHKI